MGNKDKRCIEEVMYYAKLTNYRYVMTWKKHFLGYK